MSTSRLALLSAVVAGLTLAACSRAPQPSSDPWNTGTVTLLVSERGPDIAEIVFEKNALVRIDYRTADEPTRHRLEGRVDAMVKKAERDGLSITWDEVDPERRVRSHYGANPKPGEPNFARAVYHHLLDGDFSARAK